MLNLYRSWTFQISLVRICVIDAPCELLVHDFEEFLLESEIASHIRVVNCETALFGRPAGAGSSCHALMKIEVFSIKFSIVEKLYSKRLEIR